MPQAVHGTSTEVTVAGYLRQGICLQRDSTHHGGQRREREGDERRHLLPNQQAGKGGNQQGPCRDVEAVLQSFQIDARLDAFAREPKSHDEV